LYPVLSLKVDNLLDAGEHLIFVGNVFLDSLPGIRLIWNVELSLFLKRFLVVLLN
jgi:hypothetical protein